MGVTNVNGQNQINLVKLALAKKGKVTTDNKPQYLQMTGSIFNAPKTKSTTPSVTDLNTNRSIADLDNKKINTPPVTNSTESTDTSASDIGSASEGRAAATNAENQADKARAGATETEANTRVVNDYSSTAVKLSKNIDKSDKKFQKQLQHQEAELKKDNQKLTKIIKEQEELDKQVVDAQNELESLVAYSTASVGVGETGGTSSKNTDRIKELRTLIGSKTVLMQANGKTIYSLQRSSNKTIKAMQKTNKAYVKTQNKNVNQIEEQQSSTDKILKVANKIEQISALTAQVGQLVNLAGVGLVAMSSIPGMQWAGPIGSMLQKVGKVTETVGQYGQTAASITKTAAYAADGNLIGAMQSAAAAVQTGTAAVKSTKNMGKAFDQIDASANEALQKNAAAQAADQAVEAKQNEALVELAKEQDSGVDITKFQKDGVTDYKGLKKALKENGYTNEMIENAQSDALGGMKAKDAKKWIRDDLRGQMAQNNTEVKYSSFKDSKCVNDLKDKANTSFNNVKTNYTQARNTAFTSNGITKNSDGTFTQSSSKNGQESSKNISAKKVDKLTKQSFKNQPTYTPKYSTNVGGLLKEFGNGIMSTAAMLAQSEQTATAHTNSKKTGTLAPMRYDAKLQRIIASNQRRRAAYA